MIGAKIGTTTFRNYFINFGLTEVTGMALAAAGIASILALLSLTLCVGAVTG